MLKIEKKLHEISDQRKYICQRRENGMNEISSIEQSPKLIHFSLSITKHFFNTEMNISTILMFFFL